MSKDSKWLKLSVAVLPDPSRTGFSEAALYRALQSAFGPTVIIQGASLTPAPSDGTDDVTQASLLDQVREQYAVQCEADRMLSTAIEVRRGDWDNSRAVRTMVAILSSLRSKPEREPDAEVVRLREALGKAVVFTAYQRADPLAIRFGFANDADRVAAADAVDALTQSGGEQL